VLLPTPASTISLAVPPVETLNPPVTKPARGFRYVYTHRPKAPTSEPVSANSSPVDGPPLLSASPFDLEILIALRKGKRSYIDHLILNFVSYDYLNIIFRQFALSLSSKSIPMSYTEALLVPARKQVMDEEMGALT